MKNIILFICLTSIGQVNAQSFTMTVENKSVTVEHNEAKGIFKDSEILKLRIILPELIIKECGTKDCSRFQEEKIKYKLKKKDLPVSKVKVKLT